VEVSYTILERSEIFGQLQNFQFFSLLTVVMPCLLAKYVDDEAGELCNRQQRHRVQNLKLRKKYGAYM
jgi:hypothetical protein